MRTAVSVLKAVFKYLSDFKGTRSGYLPNLPQGDILHGGILFTLTSQLGRNCKQQPAAGLGVEEKQLLVLADLGSKFYMRPEKLGIVKAASREAPFSRQTGSTRVKGDILEIEPQTSARGSRRRT